MAITQVNVSSPTGEVIFTDTVMGNAVDAIKASSAKVYSVIIDNSANLGAASYVKLFNVAASVFSIIWHTTLPFRLIAPMTPTLPLPMPPVKPTRNILATLQTVNRANCR